MTLLLLLACSDRFQDDWVPPPAEPTCAVRFRDADGDGFGDPETSRTWCVPLGGWTTDNTDCDDDDAATWPGAPEACDGEDHDCDGTESERVTWYPDEDGDGLGGNDRVWACEQPEGHVANTDDCDDTDAAVTLGDTWYLDDDDDGYGDPAAGTAACEQPRHYVADATDCDDADPGVYPGAREYCDLQDDDCDGEIDEAPATFSTTWYADADGDGFGDAATAANACYAPPGYVAEAEDCDDADADVFPGAPELDCDDPVDRNCDGSAGLADEDGDGAEACLDCDDGDATRGPTMLETCDGEDDDCDGAIDEDDAVDVVPWYTDEDLDGYGTVFSEYDCDGAPRLARTDGDCDDADPGANPGADEDCATAADDDCDGDTNDLGALGCVDWYPDADGDGYGDEEICGCTPTTATAANDADCDDDDATAHPGATEICDDGVDQDCAGDPECGVSGDLGLSDAAGSIFGASSGDYLGAGLGVLDDLDGDGFDELVVGAPGLDGTGGGEGGGYVFGAPFEGLTTADATAMLLGESAGDEAGRAAAGLGDVDGDGVADLALGAPYSSRSAGVVYLVSGVDLSGEVRLADQPSRRGTSSSSYLGGTLAGPGDVDGDGLADLLVGAKGADAAYLYAGGFTGSGSPTDATAEVTGADYTGAALVGGDLDGDGLADLVVGAPGADVGASNAGGAYVFWAPVTGAVSVADADVSIEGAHSSDQLGGGLALGDTDGDGNLDLAAGATGWDSGGYAQAGAIYIFAGPIAGPLAVEDATGTYEGEADEEAGAPLAFVDLDADGLDDLVSGAVLSRSTTYGVRVFPGPLLGVLEGAATVAGDSSDHLGEALTGMSDTDGDGFDDLWVGAWNGDDGLGASTGLVARFAGGLGP